MSKVKETEIAYNYQKIVNTLDEKRLRTTYDEVKEKFTNVSILDEEIEKEMEKLGFYPEMALNETELNANERDKLSKIETYLKDLINLRNMNVGQQIVASLLDQLDKEITQNYDDIQNKAIAKSNKFEEHVDKLNRLKESCRNKLEEVQELVRLCRLENEQSRSKTIDEENQLPDEDLAIMELKYKKIVEKNLMLSHFVTDLITSINSCDISRDEELQKILLDCADIKHFDLVNK